MGNDTTIFIIIVAFFIIMGAVAPFISSVFNVTTETHGFTITNDDSWITSTIKLIGSIFTMFFWSFGTFPLWFDITFMEILRILGYWLLYRSARGLS